MPHPNEALFRPKKVSVFENNRIADLLKPLLIIGTGEL